MYSAETQLVKALPKLAKGAIDKGLKKAFQDHLAETEGHVLRLRAVFELIGEKATGEHCTGMEGVIEEGADALEKDEEGASLDSGIIGAALRTEHYEIAGYETCIAMATRLGERKVVSLLTANLREEIAAVNRISKPTIPIMKRSAGEPRVEKKPRTSKEKSSAKKSKEDEQKAAHDL